MTFFPRYLDLIKLDKISIKLEFLQEQNVATNSKAVEVEEEDVLMATGVIVRRRKLLILALSAAIIYTRICLTIIFGATVSIIQTPLITGLLLLQDAILQDTEEDVDVEMEMEEAEVEDQEDTILITTVILPIILHLVLQQHLKSNVLMKEVVILPIWQMRTSILIM